MKKLIFSILLYLIIHSSVFAETSLWKVQSDNSVTYIGGTCHVLRKSDYPLPKEFEIAYRKSDTIIFETDIKKLNKSETQQILMSKGIYTDGSTLDKHLSPDAYNVLKEYCDEVGVSLSLLRPFKPSMAMLTLLAFELQELGVNQSGVDLYFYQKAATDGKKTEGLEMIEEHIEMVISMGEGNENDFIVHSIKDFKRTGEIIIDMIDAWKKGDVMKLSELYLKQTRKDYPNLYRTLITERNQNWIPKIEGYLQTSKREFVLVGVGHLVGKEGIIEQLKRRGYKVEKMNYKD